jgi:hypothetical protein
VTLPTGTQGILKTTAISMPMERYGSPPCKLQQQFHKITIIFESLIDLGAPIYDQIIRNKKREKIMVIIRAIKFQIWGGSAIWSAGINSSLAEKISFSIENIQILPFLNRMIDQSMDLNDKNTFEV